jgi:ABC-2 type transport system ATP-binding protein
VNYAVAIERLNVRRGGRTVLHDLTARLEAGRVTGLLGPSGCGKTTLMRAIVGVQRVAGGSVRVLDRPAGTPALRSRVAYVTQAPSVYADLTVLENLRYFARVLGAPAARVGEALAAVDLADAGERMTGTLSGGQRSRVSLACALLGRPELFILDEPTVGLDPVLRRDLWALFHRLADDGATLLVSSHVMDEAVRCDDLLLMRDGRLVADTTPDELRERTGEHDLEAAFLRLIEERAMKPQLWRRSA